jgi:signal peptidase
VKPTKQNVLNGLLFVLLVVVVVPFVVYAVPGVVGAEHSFVVLSGSMEPAMSPGDVVVVDGVDPANVEEGDVVTFATSGDGPPTTHRVIETVETADGRAFRTKGDANEDPDQGLVRPQQIVGEVEYAVPYVGHVVNFVNTPVGFASLVIAPLGLLAVSEFYAIVSRSGDGRNDEEVTPPAATGASTEPPVSDDSVAAKMPDSPAVAEAATVDATADSDSDADGDDGFTLSRTELRLALGVFAVVAPYTIFVAYRIREGWTVTAAVAATLSLLFAAMAYRNTTSGDGVTAPSDAGATPVAPGQIPDETDRDRVEISSLESLVEMATDGGDWLFADEDGYYVLREDRVYVHERDPTDLLNAFPSEELDGEGTGGDGS